MVMAYGRETFMNGMRVAGQKLGEFDDMYSKAIRMSAPQQDEINNPIDGARAYAAQFMGIDRNYNSEKNPINPVMKGAMVSSRYVLPAAGVTAAGVALYDLTNQFGGTADRPEPGQLGMGS